MSSRAKRISNPGSVLAFPWNRSGRLSPSLPEASQAAVAAQVQLEAAAAEAYAKGYAEGEAAGAAATEQDAAALLRRLGEALDGVVKVRSDMLRRSERQMVELALAVAERIVQRELAADPALLLQMARGVLDRLGDDARVTVRLHPHDYDAVGGSGAAGPDPRVAVVADAKVERGGCRVESDLGTLDAGVEAQILEFGRALLGEDAPTPLSNVA